MLPQPLLTLSLNIPKGCFPAAWGMEETRPVAVCQWLPAGAREEVTPWPCKAQWLLQCQRELWSMWLFYLLRSNLEPQDEIRNL